MFEKEPSHLSCPSGSFAQEHDTLHNVRSSKAAAFTERRLPVCPWRPPAAAPEGAGATLATASCSTLLEGCWKQREKLHAKEMSLKEGSGFVVFENFAVTPKCCCGVAYMAISRSTSHDHHGLGSVGSLAGAAAKHGAFNGGITERPLEVRACFGHVSMRMRDIINVSHRSTSLQFESFFPLDIWCSLHRQIHQRFRFHST